MARVPLIDETAHPELADEIATLKSGRRGELINVYRLLLNSPDLAMGWYALLNAVRFETGLDDVTREIVIVRVAILNDVRYVINQHVPQMALDAGLTMKQCESLRAWQTSDAFDDEQRAVLAYTDAMTQNVRVADDIAAALLPYFDDRQRVELTVLIAAYNMHTRVLSALQIDPEPGHGEHDAV